MSPPRSDKELFFEAIEKASALERAAFLDAACGADAALRARLEVLLADHFRDDGFMKAAVAEVVSQPEPGAPPTESHTLSFGRYKLLEKIGEGGFGDVWMAEQREPVKRRVALKILKPGMDSRQIVARFEAERQTLAMMDHPHIAKIFDAGMTDTGRPYFVMELVRGIRITDYCDQHQLPTRGRLDLFIQVCQAIQHAHQKGIIHRDVKPSNILVTVNDGVAVPKVIDFGIAKATQGELTDKTVFTQFQQFIGTPAYISPEQAEMSSLDIDTRADIYSLGVVLYEVLVGQTPFDVREMVQGGLDALRQIIREKDPQRPSTRLKTLPGDSRTTAAKRRQTDVGRLVHQLEGDLDWIVMKCLEKDRTRRYDTANGLAMDIQRHLTNEPVLARPPSTAYRLHKMVRRNRKAFAAAAVVAMTLVVSATYSTVQAVRAQRAAKAARASEDLASTALATAERERDLAKRANDKLQSSLTRFQFNRAVTFLDAGEYSQGAAFLARALRTDPSYWPAAARLISVLTERGFSLDVLPPFTHEQPIYDHVLSSATGLLVTRGPDYDIRIWNAWKRTLLLELPAPGVRQMPVLSPDGRKVLLLDTNGAARIYEPLTNPRGTLVTLQSDDRIVQAVFSPSQAPGLRVATRQANGTIQLWNGETGTALGTPLSGGAADGGFLAFTRDGTWLAGSFADHRVGLWPVASTRGAARFIAVEPNSLVRLTPDSQTLVERRADDRSLRFWNLADGQPRGDAIVFDEPLARMAVEPGREGDRGQFLDLGFQFDPSGRWMVAVSRTTFEAYSGQRVLPVVEVRLFDTREGRLLRTLSETNVISHEENAVAGLSLMVIEDKRLLIRELATGRVLMDRTWVSDLIRAARLSPAGDRVLVALNDHRLLMFETRTGQCLTHEGNQVWTHHTAGGSGRTRDQTYFMRHDRPLALLEFSPEGDVFVATYVDRSVQIWDAFEGLPLTEPMPELVGRLNFSQDGRSIVLANIIRRAGESLYRLGRFQTIERDPSPARYSPLRSTGDRPALHFTPDGSLGLLASRGITLFDAHTGAPVRSIENSASANIDGSTSWLIREVSLSPDAAKLLYFVGDGELRKLLVHETRTGQLLQEIPIEKPWFSRFVGNDRVLVVTRVEDGTEGSNVMRLRLWDLPSRSVRVDRLSPGPIHLEVLDVSPDGSRIALSGRDTWILDGATLEPVAAPLANHFSASTVYSVRISPDGQRLATGGFENFIRIWNTRTGAMEAEFDVGGWARWIEFSPDSQRVTAGAGSYDVENPLFVWQLNGPKPRLLSGPMRHLNCLQHEVFSADGRYVLGGDRRGDVKLWDLDTQLPVNEPLLLEGDHGVTRVGLNPQMSRLFAATGDGFLHSRPLPPREGPVPEWLPSLAEAVARRRVNEAGGTDPLGREELAISLNNVRAAVSVARKDDFYARWGHWFVGDRATRTLSPFSDRTVPEEVAALIEEGSLSSLRKALRMAPANPRVLQKLALRMLELAPNSEGFNGANAFFTPPEYYARLAVARAPDSAEARSVLAEVLRQMGKPETALPGGTRLERW